MIKLGNASNNIPNCKDLLNKRLSNRIAKKINYVNAKST